jgi:hypothetical protein
MLTWEDVAWMTDHDPQFWSFWFDCEMWEIDQMMQSL